MRKEILAALKTKYSQFGLGDKTLEAIAASLEPNVKEEKDIETAIAGVEPFLKIIQSSLDSFRGEKSTLMSQIDELKKQVPVKTGKDDEGEGLTVDSVKSIIAELIKPINDRFEKQDAIERAADRRSQIIAKAAEYKIPEAVAKYMQVPDDADLDAFIKQAKQDFSDNGFSEVQPPQTGEQKVKTEAESIAKMISDETNKQLENQKK